MLFVCFIDLKLVAHGSMARFGTFANLSVLGAMAEVIGRSLMRPIPPDIHIYTSTFELLLDT